ncbi:MAG: glycosyltransferase family 39 protein [Phycisphaerae bacterium]|nr:glycosyltransferase family 39 protein [Phycisphaerae bacterium]
MKTVSVQSGSGIVGRWRLPVLTACVVVAGVLRFWAAGRNDFWVDEIWSLYFARRMTYPWEVLTEILNNNSHPLNTLYMYLIGNRTDCLWYRLPSAILGTATIPLLARAVGRGRPGQALLTAWLAAVSYPLVLYSSEARGYAPAVFFSVAAFVLLKEYSEHPRAWMLPLFWVSLVAGFLFHATVAYVILSLALWSFLRAARRSTGRRGAYVELAKCYAVPLLILMPIYLFHTRRMHTGGGPAYATWRVVANAMDLAIGAPTEGPLAIVCVLLGAALCARGLYLLWKSGSDEWIPHGSVLLLAPACVVILTRPPLLYVRFFLVCFPFAYLLFGQAIAGLYQGSKPGRVAAVALVCLFTAGNVPRLARLFHLGRGGYREAVLHMASETSGSTIEVGSDHDFRNAMVLDFYARYLPAGKKLSYRLKDDWPRNGPEWVLAHSRRPDYHPDPRIMDAGGNTYSLSRVFGYCGMSGWTWAVYHNERFGVATKPTFSRGIGGLRKGGFE